MDVRRYLRAGWPRQPYTALALSAQSSSILKLAIPGRLELPTCGLGNRRSIRLSYGTSLNLLPKMNGESD